MINPISILQKKPTPFLLKVKHTWQNQQQLTHVETNDVPKKLTC